MSDQNAVNPAERDEDNEHPEQPEGERAQTGSNPDQRAGLQQRQAEQNQSHNDRFDPSVGAKQNQKRRNDKRGQMGG